MARRFEHGVIDSTNERALAMVEAGDAQHLDVHVAQAQTAGRGRRGRPWISEAGAGLFLSLVWRAPRVTSGAAMTVAAGLAALDAVRALGLGSAELEWPNDVLAPGGKLAGVLIETRGLGNAAPLYVVGVGVNVTQLRFPDWLASERAVTSLVLEGIQATAADLELELVEALASRLAAIEDDAAGLAADYLAATGFTGQVRGETADGPVEGEVVRLDLERGLTLRTAAGETTIPLERLRQLAPRSG
ncbi:MAG: biotin--[acetyl-CoA-carboxylase] ligase [Planctomycetota bacterium]|nr:biotin--[acetyl-CoA-carboxylase] ligase [Planctomycetota bacterium]